MTRPVPATRLHAERTRDPAVLRWVVHDPTVTAATDGPRAPDDARALGRLLVAQSAVVSVAVHRGTVLVTTAHPDEWPTLAPHVHAAIATDLATSAPWLTARPQRTTQVTLTPRP